MKYSLAFLTGWILSGILFNHFTGKLPVTVEQRTGQNWQNSGIQTMATKTTKDDLKNKSVFIDASAFAELGGETYAGLNILKLKPGQAAGPITIKKVLPNQILGKDSAAKKRKPVDVYVGEFQGTEMRMPVAASFVMKAKDAKIGPGDVIAILREENYATKHDGKGGEARGQSYQLKVVSRASGKK